MLYDMKDKRVMYVVHVITLAGNFCLCLVNPLSTPPPTRKDFEKVGEKRRKYGHTGYFAFSTMFYPPFSRANHILSQIYCHQMLPTWLI